MWEAEQWATKKYPVHNKDGQARYAAAYQGYLAGYASGSKSKWLKYPENKPANRVFCVVTNGYGFKWGFHVSDENGDFVLWDLNGGSYTYNVTHWQPIQLPDQSVSKEGE